MVLDETFPADSPGRDPRGTDVREVVDGVGRAALGAADRPDKLRIEAELLHDGADVPRQGEAGHGLANGGCPKWRKEKAKDEEEDLERRGGGRPAAAATEREPGDEYEGEVGGG